MKDLEKFEPIIHTELSAEEFRNHPVWIAELTIDGCEGDILKVYSKPYRRSWLELKEYLRQNPRLSVWSLIFRFRDHYERIASDKDGFFFSHGCKCWYGLKEQDLFIGGYVENSRIHRKKFILPELTLDEDEDGSDIFPIDHIEMQRGLILHPNIKKWDKISWKE